MPPKDPLSPWTQLWHITINTNSANPELIKPLKIVWEYITQRIAKFSYRRTIGERTGKILKVIDNPHVEVGGKKHRIHLHSELEIESEGIAFLDYDMIKTFINQQLSQVPSFTGAYFHADLAKNYNARQLIQQYVEKGPELEEPATEFKITGDLPPSGQSHLPPFPHKREFR